MSGSGSSRAAHVGIASSINLKNSSIYALKTMATFATWHLHKAGIKRSPLFDKP